MSLKDEALNAEEKGCFRTAQCMKRRRPVVEAGDGESLALVEPRVEKRRRSNVDVWLTTLAEVNARLEEQSLAEGQSEVEERAEWNGRSGNGHDSLFSQFLTDLSGGDEMADFSLDQVVEGVAQ